MLHEKEGEEVIDPELVAMREEKRRKHWADLERFFMATSPLYIRLPSCLRCRAPLRDINDDCPSLECVAPAKEKQDAPV